MSDGFQLNPALVEWCERFNRTLVDGFNQYMERPEVKAVIELCSRPEVQAAVERASREYRHNPCYCFCGVAHPGKHVCDGNAVRTIRRVSRHVGTVDVPTCSPCAAALLTKAVQR